MPNYIVVLRASSAAKFHPEQPSLKAQAFPTPVGPVDMTFQTRYADEGFNVTIPRELWVDARGPAPSLDDAIKAFWNAAQMPVAVIALTTNAAIEDLDLHLAYDNTPGRSEREFFQNFLPEERGIPRQGRRVPVDATVSLLRAIDTHPERDRLLRAIAYYYNALSHWKPGRETFVLAYLYMGMEALTKAFRRQHCQRANCTESQLAASWGIELKNLDPEVRKRLLFKGDHECYKKAKAASDGLEHGFLTFDKVLSYAQDAYERTASYLRSAIIELTEVEESANQVLFSPKYEQPLQLWKAAKYLRGRLLGQTDKLAAEGQEYPIFRWQSSIKAVTRIDSGDYNLSLNENLTASLGEGVSFQPNSLEVWGPHKYPKIR